MSERSVAEIIGWEFHARQPGSGPFWMRPNGTFAGSADPTITVDDMLAWLKSGGLVFAANADINGIYLAVTADEWEWDTTQPTLHAALEAAVRAVGEVKS